VTDAITGAPLDDASVPCAAEQPPAVEQAVPALVDESPHTRERARLLMAILFASGAYTDDEIAQRCGTGVAVVRTLRQSPLFMALVNSCRERFREKAIDYVLDDIMADAPDNVAWLKKMRGSEPVVYDPKLARLQLRAAEVLFSRQVPKPIEQKDVRVGVVLSTQAVERLARIAAVDEAIDV
jgi:hypothetical protein